MCLILTVRLAEADAPRTAEIAQAAGLPIAPKRWWSRLTRSSSGTLSIAGPAGGCGCSFLADSADWDAPTWDMIPDTLPRLADILRAIRQHTTAAFSFDALWIGESPTEERRIAFGELLHLVEQSRLGTKTRYLIEYDHAVEYGDRLQNFSGSPLQINSSPRAECGPWNETVSGTVGA